MKNLLEAFLDLIYRKKCYFCGNSKYAIRMCPNCYDKLEFSGRISNRIIDGVDIYCAGVYTKELQKLIRGVKYHKQRELAYFQAKFMYEYFSEIKNLKNKEFVLIPVPLHKNRIKKRHTGRDSTIKEATGLKGLVCGMYLKARNPTNPINIDIKRLFVFSLFFIVSNCMMLA